MNQLIMEGTTLQEHDGIQSGKMVVHPSEKFILRLNKSEEDDQP